MHKRFYIVSSLLLALLICFTQIAPGFLHRHHCYADDAFLSGESKHTHTAVHKEKAEDVAVFSDQCPICAAQSTSDLYFHHFAVSVTPPEHAETAFFYHTSSGDIPPVAGSSRAPPFGLS